MLMKTKMSKMKRWTGVQKGSKLLFYSMLSRSLQSTVIMPAIETKSRDEKIQELAKSEKKEVVSRNKRMFSNLMGTLSQFKRSETKPMEAEKKQQEKLNKVDKKLEQAKIQEKEKVLPFLLLHYCF